MYAMFMTGYSINSQQSRCISQNYKIFRMTPFLSPSLPLELVKFNCKYANRISTCDIMLELIVLVIAVALSVTIARYSQLQSARLHGLDLSY